MSETFPARIHRALADPKLGAALGRMSHQLATRREAAFQSLEHAGLVRDHARRAKLETLRDLASALERFEAAVLARGAAVHWAETGADACRIVADIARRHDVRRVAKAKSMASEEIHLNDALEHAGLEVVETDLGEYVVQLAADRPSHIVAPIIHMSREDVGRVMHERIGAPLTGDPAVLGRFAREKLRGTFLAADMGITGANFGVVETGTLCLVTNEGNGRMVTTLPRVHVAIVGIEKLIPGLADLDRFLKLLARSATGQKLTAYTTLVSGPRRPGDACGPEALHVVLLDNGRSGILATERAEILGCIRCGACMNACPVYTSIGGHAYGDTYPGPIGAVLTPGLRGLPDWGELAGASSLCGACREVCPVRLDIPRMLLGLRDETAPAAAPRWLRGAMSAFARVVARPRLYRLATRAARTALRLQARDGWLTRLPGPAGAWTTSRDLRAPAKTTFQQLHRAAGNKTRARAYTPPAPSAPSAPGAPGAPGAPSAPGAPGAPVHRTAPSAPGAPVASASARSQRPRELRRDLAEAASGCEGGPSAPRSAILTRLRAARASARLPRMDAPPPIPARTLARDALLDRFLAEAAAIGVECFRESTEDGVRARVAALVAGQRVLAWDPPALPYDVGRTLGDSMPGSAAREELAAADIGVTGCDGAIAETGSIVLLSAPGRSRAVSLLPPTHLAIVRPPDLHGTMGDFFAARPDAISDHAACTFVTGPSRTADIELTLTLGIHGPGRIICVVGP